MSTPSIILYDTTGKNRPWNPMSLKTRMALEYKQIPYRTIWLEYPEIEPTMLSIGGKPSVRPDGESWYTIPVIIDEINPGPDGKPVTINDSWIIAEYLDEKFPDRPLFPKGSKGLQSLFHETFIKIAPYGTAQLMQPHFYENLNEASQPYFRTTREGYFRKSFAEMCPKGSPEWDEMWSALEKGLDELAMSLNKNGPLTNYPYVMGNILSYADLTIVAVLYPFSIFYPAEWEKIRGWNGGRWGQLLDKCSALVTQT